MIKYRLLAFVLRGLALLSRFFLVIVVARVLSADEFGLFMLFIAAGQLASALASMDVYAETSRVILTGDTDQRLLLSKHFSFISASAILVAPVATILFWLQDPHAPYLVVVLLPLFIVAETIGNDFGRLFAPLGKPVWASLYIFLRQAPLTIVIFLMSEVLERPISLNETIGLLVASSIVVIIPSIIWLSGRHLRSFITALDPLWAGKIIKGSILFFIATMIFRSVMGLDKFIVSNVTDLTIVGVYAFFVSIGMGILSVAEAGVSSWYYPKLVKAVMAGETKTSISVFFGFMKANFISTIVLAGIAISVVPFIIEALLGPEYRDGLTYFPLILAGVICLSLSLPFHYLIYAKRQDTKLILIYSLALSTMMLYAVIWLAEGTFAEAFGMFFVIAATIAIGRLIGAIQIIRSKDY